ncbi:hypothetical protein DPMN_131862 [Dreissena polymorpha]|uniref:Uncharacterized protein n=1 Tax=Dreissena polymorpha TaxID=45954 RepID=A0A9D4FX84_DREPO|nr:hypothetical protein DPMN_131862 [Dreissena polymorpha]
MSLKDVFFNLLLLCSSPYFFIGDLVWPANLEDLPEAGLNEVLYFLYGGDHVFSRSVPHRGALALLWY